MENIIGALSKIALVHEHDAKTGENRYVLAQKAADEDDEE